MVAQIKCPTVNCRNLFLETLFQQTGSKDVWLTRLFSWRWWNSLWTNLGISKTCMLSFKYMKVFHLLFVSSNHFHFPFRILYPSVHQPVKETRQTYYKVGLISLGNYFTMFWYFISLTKTIKIEIFVYINGERNLRNLSEPFS